MALRKRTSTRFSARMIAGSVPAAEMPGFIGPQSATLKLKPPAGDKWVHEIKYDGYRVQVHVDKGKVRCFTRSGLDWTKKFAVIAEGFEGLPTERAIFDGEVCVIKDGRTDFSALQAELASGRQRSLVYYVFDLLFLDGFDLRKVPQIERKRLLENLLKGVKPPIVYSEHMDDGVAMFAGADRLNWEGIISKRADAPYRSDRNEGWLKIKTSKREQLHIVGYVQAIGGIAALHVARREGKKMTYLGKVGTGFTNKVSADLRKLLDALPAPKVKLAMKRHIRAVEPTLIAEVEYREITSEGYLRHSSFKGLAED
jgi:bifunctional non-homologous end joining protein LigD